MKIRQFNFKSALLIVESVKEFGICQLSGSNGLTAFLAALERHFEKRMHCLGTNGLKENALPYLDKVFKSIQRSPEYTRGFMG